MKLLLIIFTLIPYYTFAENKGGLFVEPILSYEKTDFDVDYPSPLGKSEGDLTGLGLGARLGFHVYESVFVGIDGRYTSHEFNDNDNDFKSDASGYNYGPVVGIQLPTELSIRVWGSYILGGQLDPDKSNNLDVKFEKASGYRLGTGIMISNLSLNLEYQTITYDKTKLESLGPFSSGTSFDNVEMNNDGYVLSLSFPYSL